MRMPFTRTHQRPSCRPRCATIWFHASILLGGSTGSSRTGASQLMHLIGVEPQPLHSQNHHPHTSADSGFRPREEMTTYLAQSPESTLQLCFVFLPDFVCLNYPLPPACHKLASSGVIAEICATCNRAGNASLFSAAECEGAAARNLESQPQCAARRSWNTDVFQVTGVNPQYPEKTPGLQEWLTQCNGIYQEGLECHNTSVALVADQLMPSTMSPDRRSAVTGVLFLRITGCFFEFMRAEHFLSHPSRPIQAMDHWDAYLKSGGDTPIAGERIPIPPPRAIGAVLLAYEYLKDAVPFSNLPALYRVEDSINQFAYSFEEWLLCSRPDAQQAARHQTNTQLLAVSTSACADKLLISGQELTLTVHLTFSGNGKSIWGWRTPERNGYLRWEVLPAHGHDSITCGMPIAPLAAKRNFARCGTVPYDEAGMDTGEVILLPGSRFSLSKACRDLPIQPGTPPFLPVSDLRPTQTGLAERRSRSCGGRGVAAAHEVTRMKIYGKMRDATVTASQGGSGSTHQSAL